MEVNSSEDRVFVFDPENKVDVVHGYYVFFGSMLSFLSLNWVVYKIGKPEYIREEEGRWRNLLISWIHGFIVGSWDILCLYFYPELIGDLIHHLNYFTYSMVAFSTGYFLYDFIDLIIQKRIAKNYEVTLHHLAVISMFWYNFHCKMCIAYNVVALMAEINSFFLHFRKLLQMAQFRFDHWFYRFIVTLNLLTFFFCRGWSLSRISYGMYTENEEVPTFYFNCLCLSIFVMNVINPILFWRLLKNDFLRYWGTKKTDKKIVMNGNNNIHKNHIKSN